MSSRMKGWLITALILVLLGAFTVSATSTYRLGERQHLADLALYALILMLELGSVTGAAIFVATKRNSIRLRAGIVIGLATGVACVGAVQSYGFLVGIPVSAILLLLVDLIGAFWSEQERATVSDQKESTQEKPAEPTEEIATMTESAQVTVIEEAPIEPVWTVETILDDLQTNKIDSPNQRYIRTNYKVGAGKANKVLEAISNGQSSSTVAA